MIDAVDVILITGTTLVNGTFDLIWARTTSREKTAILFGVTAVGVCKLLGLERICPYALSG